MLGFAAGIVGNLNAHQGDSDDHEARYLNCALVGAKADHECPALTDETEDQNQQLFNIGVATIILNVIFLLWSIAAHWDFGLKVHFLLQWVFSAVNVGLFAGLVGWFNASEGLFEEENLENSVFFKDQADPYVLAVIPLILGVLDLVLFNVLNLSVFKDRCKA